MIRPPPFLLFPFLFVLSAWIGSGGKQGREGIRMSAGAARMGWVRAVFISDFTYLPPRPALDHGGCARVPSWAMVDWLRRRFHGRHCLPMARLESLRIPPRPMEVWRRRETVETRAGLSSRIYTTATTLCFYRSLLPLRPSDTRL